MAPRAYTWFLSGALALGALAPASAQIVPSLGGPSVGDFTGVVSPATGRSFGYLGALVTPTAYVPPRIPNTWITPQYVFHYEAPRVIYVPVAVEAPRPPVETVPVTVLTLRSGSALPEARVKAGAVVTWLNATDQERTVSVRPATLTRKSDSEGSESTRIRANGTFSLIFRQPGAYEYSLQDRPEERARITVEE